MLAGAPLSQPARRAAVADALFSLCGQGSAWAQSPLWWLTVARPGVELENPPAGPREMCASCVAVGS